MADEPAGTPTTGDQATTTPVPPPAPVAQAFGGPKTSDKNPYVWGLGRRKTAVARVRIKPGDGTFLINKRKVDDFFGQEKDRDAVRNPLKVTDTAKTVDVFVNVGGGGVSGQAGAVALGLSRALATVNPDYAIKLKEHNLLTRDARKVERKKYGQRGARRRFQFSKR